MAINSVDIPTYIEYGKIGTFVASDFITKKSYFGNPYFNPTQPQSIYCATKALENIYLLSNYSAAAQSMAAYQFSLYSGFIGNIKKIIGNAQGIVVTPTNPSLPTYLVQQREYPQFEIGQPNSPMNDGDTTLTINDSQIAPQTPDATLEIHVDGLQEGQGLIDQSSFTAVYSPGQYVITFNNPVRTGNVIMPKYPVQLNLTYQTTAVLDTTYTAQLINIQTKTLVNTAGNIFIVQSGTVNVSNFTLFCVSTADEVFIMQWNATVKNIGGVVTIYNDSYGVIQDDFAGALVVAITADQTHHGVAITVTGISGKTINCRAIFTNTPNALT
jgi:hypothetical protein